MKIKNSKQGPVGRNIQFKMGFIDLLQYGIIMPVNVMYNLHVRKDKLLQKQRNIWT